MTEMIYTEPVASFVVPHTAQDDVEVPLLEAGVQALKKLNVQMGLGMDDWDVQYYTNFFIHDLKRNPTMVELFQLSQANSEHSRHWFFRGKHIIDGTPKSETLFQIVQSTHKAHPDNSVVAFADNSSAIRGATVDTIIPKDTRGTSPFVQEHVTYHPLLTAETHNFPTGVAPVPGAETGAGGRMRDVEAIGRGGIVMAGLAGYCVGDLSIPTHAIAGEGSFDAYPSNLANPLSILIGASNGASDYGNKFGEPLLGGFTRTGELLHNTERRAWLKPIMFSAGIGQLRDEHVHKEKPKKGMVVIAIGGPMYRIGVGGGSASSVGAGDQSAELDFNAVQRGDPEMQQKVNRVVHACVDLGAHNPILSIHDQGAGGPCNVLTELVEPEGARINLRAIGVGDSTLSVLEIWGAESQERNALLVDETRVSEFEALCARERVPCEILGNITGDGRIVLFDAHQNKNHVDLELEKILGKLPQKTFTSEHPDVTETDAEQYKFAQDVSIKSLTEKVFSLPGVGSKNFLVHKVDRSVGGLTVQQQCVGPLQLPVADCAVVAQSHFDTTGIASSIGEQPIKMLANPQAGARLAVAEALTNLAGVAITKRTDIKCSLNWMWAPKLPHEGALLYDAAEAVRDCMIAVGMAVDGGKDSLSMVAKWKDESGEHVVKAPGAMVVTTYAHVPNIAQVVTPDIKHAGESTLIHIALSHNHRLGGSALLQAHGAVGAEVPDVDDTAVLNDSFDALQELVRNQKLLAIHDISDGGLLTTALEMAISGNAGMRITLPAGDAVAMLFAEEPGWVIECATSDVAHVVQTLNKVAHAPIVTVLGTTNAARGVVIVQDDTTLFEETIDTVIGWWNSTSNALELLQRNLDVVRHEANIVEHTTPQATLSFVPAPASTRDVRPSVAIVREEGSNGDKEMASAFYEAGFTPCDVSMQDLLSGETDMRRFRGAAFVGGFSYADVLGSAKGWAGVLKFNPMLKEQFKEFYAREDTFSLGVCNGCQLMTQLGWVLPELGDAHPRCVHNASGKFESRFPSVKITDSPSIFLRGMAGSIMPVWVAHGEGRMLLSPEARAYIQQHNLAPIQFVDPQGVPTESYPYNPNGSPEGITALTSKNGRHLALMPHPERLFKLWQWPHVPKAFGTIDASPWLKLFTNVREWAGE
jgi:phosphoribosylformylglycinamidine synthase